MEKTRYEFRGFTFGTQNWFNLTVRINNHADHGTSYLGEISIELNDEERLELIKLLINADNKEGN